MRYKFDSLHRGRLWNEGGKTREYEIWAALMEVMRGKLASH